MKVKTFTRIAGFTLLSLLFAVPHSQSQVAQQDPALVIPQTRLLSGAADRMDVMPEFPVRRGIASWYSETDPGINLHTANMEIFDDTKMTCASWEYPFGTFLLVTNLKNGKSVVCRVNDRGPAKRLNRVIDLTKAAFGMIASHKAGLIKVTVMPLIVKGRAVPNF